VPAALAIVHSLLLLFCFNFETPVYLNEQNQQEKLLQVMKRFYHPTEVKARIASLTALQTNEVGS